MKTLEKLKARARKLKSQVYVLYYASRHPRTPWYAKLVVLAVVAYALSPIDLIPDFIPVLGYLDDLILLPLGIALALRLIPEDVMRECAEKAAERGAGSGKNWKAATVVIAVWGVALAVVGKWLYALFVAFHG